MSRRTMHEEEVSGALDLTTKEGLKHTYFQEYLLICSLSNMYSIESCSLCTGSSKPTPKRAS